MSVKLRIDTLGAHGHGIARTERGQVFVPFTLPGEVVNAAVEGERGTVMAVLELSPERVEPPCRHFGSCGGCSLQHQAESAYRAFKTERVAAALRRERIDIALSPIVPCAPASRRRVVLGGRKTVAGVLLGYHRMQSAEIVDIEECPIARPEIVAALPMLRHLAGQVCQSSKPFHLTVTSTDTGLDLAFAEIEKLPDPARRAAADFATRHRIARLSVDGDIVVEPNKPIVRYGPASVTPPPGGFLQAVASAEQAMADMVLAHLARSKRVADLFCGSGAFALRLASGSEVHAVEAEAGALAALERGYRFSPGLKRVTTEKRDLFRRPLTVKDLDAFDGLVFDPPRAGAEDQSRQIARSTVPKVAAVSCNPVTLARDLRILLDGGYTLLSVTPVDQFLWSPHVEAVALLEKPRKRR